MTAVGNLRKDLIFTIDSTKDALLEIENIQIRMACQEVVRLTLKNIIQRIDDELLDIEKQQIIDAFWNGDNTDCTSEQDSKEFAKKYFKETYEQ